MKCHINNLILIISGIIVLNLFTYNLFFNSDFLIIPIYHLLNLIVAILFTFYFVQKRTDDRKTKEVLEDLISKIQNEIADKESYNFFIGFDKKVILQKIRRVRNKIFLLDKFKDKFNITEEVEYISKNFDEYRNDIGEKIEDTNYLINNQKKYLKYLSLIDDKCDQLRIKLYQ